MCNFVPLYYYLGETHDSRTMCCLIFAFHGSFKEVLSKVETGRQVSSTETF